MLSLSSTATTQGRQPLRAESAWPEGRARGGKWSSRKPPCHRQLGNLHVIYMWIGQHGGSVQKCCLGPVPILGRFTEELLPKSGAEFRRWPDVQREATS